MKKENNMILQRMLAVVLSLVMILSMLPLSAVTFAATEKYPEALTVTVTDGEGAPIAEATVTLVKTENTWELALDPQLTDDVGVAAFSNEAIEDALTGAGLSEGSFQVKVARDGFETAATLVTVTVGEPAQNIDVALETKESTTIDDVEIKAIESLVFDGTEQELVSVTKVAGDTVEYYFNGSETPQSDVPKATEAGKYTVRVVVTREGKEPLDVTVEAEIQKAEIKGVELTPLTPDYNGEEQVLVELSGTEEGDVLSWLQQEEDTGTQDYPSATAVGKYTIELTVTRNDNYWPLTLSCEAYILGRLDLDGLEVYGLDSIYQIDPEGNPVAQPAVTVENKGDYQLWYQLDDGDFETDEEAWTDEIPTVTEAGSYIVWVKAVKEAYHAEDIEVIPAESAEEPYNVFVAKANQSLAFDNYNSGSNSKVEISGAVPYKNNNVFDFHATDSAQLAEGTVSYAVRNSEENIAEINESGTLVVYYPGVITVNATLSGNNNYNPCTITYVLTVFGVTEEDSQGQFILFKEPQVYYTLGANKGVASAQKAERADDKIDGDITYSMTETEGLAIDDTTGEVSVADYALLAAAMLKNENGTIVVTVRADKATTDKYDEDSAEYQLAISFAEASAEQFTLTGDKEEETGWYRSEVKVIPAAGYMIAENLGASAEANFDGELVFTDQGTKTYSFFLKNTESGEIGSWKDILSIDTQDPRITNVSYGKPLVELILEAVTFGFYNSSVTVTVQAEDDTSGLNHLDWSYTRAEDASEINLDASSGTIIFENGETEVKLPLSGKDAQYRGSIEFTVTDNAGRTCESVNNTNLETDKTYGVVVDTISPGMTAAFGLADANPEHGGVYNPVEEIIYINEDAAQPETEPEAKTVTHHYFNGDVKFIFTVCEANFYPEDTIISVMKDGEVYEAFDQGRDVTWTDVENTDEHVGSFILSGDGDYVVSMSYQDKSGNVMKDAETKEEIELYTSEEITIDTVAPVDLEIAYSVDLYTPDNNPEEDTVIDTLLEVFTLGFYNPKVKSGIAVVTFTAKDEFTGVQNFVWRYQRAEDASVINVENYEDNVVAAKRDPQNSNVYTTTIELPLNVVNELEEQVKENKDYDQLKGFVEVTAIDFSGNSTAKSDEESYQVIVDSITPVLGVSYSKESGAEQSQPVLFYGNEVHDCVVITLQMNEANFFPEDVVVVDSMDGKKTVDWVDDPQNDTMHSGSFTISKEGRHNFTVEYTDRSKNVMEKYTSPYTLVIDATRPTATVSYNNPVNTVGNVSYYDGSVQGTINVAETNFDSSRMSVVVSKDGGASWQPLATNWSGTVGNFTLTEDGDYLVRVYGTDKANNSMTEYKSGRMTVDTKIEAPTFTVDGKAKYGNNGGAYNTMFEVTYSFADQNFDTDTIKLTCTRFNQEEDVTEKYIKPEMNVKGGSGKFKIPWTVLNDGIYRLTITMTDKAKHQTVASVRFAVNRYGSVYTYSDYLCSLIKDGGQYITAANGGSAINEDLVITEYNADKIVDGSLKIMITRDGEPVEPAFDRKEITSTGWFEYEYTISKDNFQEDGVYKITIASEDATGNASASVPENSFDKDGAQILDVMTFTVDTVAPEILNVVNLENAIADRDAIIDGKLNVKYTLVDVGGIAKVEVYLNGELIDTIEEFENNNNFSGTFDINESNEVQTVRIVVTDMAGNVTDTASETFDPGELFVYNDRVTVSTNFFIRWYHNTLLFWGSIGGVGLAAAGAGFAISKKKRKFAEAE